MAQNPDYIVEISGLAGQDGPRPMGGQADPIAGGEPAEPADAKGSPLRKWIGVHFTCCDVYTRIWRNHEGTAYVGYCPRCNRKVQARIGPDGTTSRFFEAG